jgi:hypothetical protein
MHTKGHVATLTVAAALFAAVGASAQQDGDGKPVATQIIDGETGVFEGTLFDRTLGKGDAETLMVARGASVRLVLHVAPGTKLHLHGYDIEGAASADGTAIMTFDARHPGRFAISAHGGKDVLGRTEKALAYLEVRP